MKTESASSLSLNEKVCQRLRNDILLGAYHPGERLDVNKLVGQYGVSRTPIRDALNVLQREGLVEIVGRVGYFIARITIRDIEDIFQLRLIVETASAELAARLIISRWISWPKSPCQSLNGSSARTPVWGMP